MWPITAPLLRYVCLGAAVLAVLGVVLGFTWRKGYKTAEAEYRLVISEMELAQARYAEAQAIRISKALAKQHNREAEITERISEITIPDSDSCTDPDWVLTHNAIVQALRDS